MASARNRYGGTGTPTGAGALSAARAITQEGAGVPAHTAPKNTLYRNTATNFVYINTDGATTWALVGGGAGTPGATGPQGPSGNDGRDGEPGEQGPPGLKGDAGTVGATGAMGPPGPQGPTGNDGADGQDGAQGSMGATGAAGTAGASGPAGADGAAGPQGAPGADGANGTDGADGATGPQGATGAMGNTGPAGADGAAGSQGPAGLDGAPGADGDQGPPGAAGATGATGAPGADGAAGAIGPPGPAGQDGADGDQGPSGPMGATGATGANGTPGSAGADGMSGAQGPPGADGQDGAPGEQGPQGLQGALGATGANGADGATGAQGPPGADGIDGADGRDGAPGTTDHHLLMNLVGFDDHTQYALLAGRAGGQTLSGDTAAAGILTLQGTAHATVGTVTIVGSLNMITGTVYVGFTGFTVTVPNAACAVLIGDSADDYNGKMGLGVFMGQTYALAANNVIGIAGKVAAISTTSTTVGALDFTANHTNAQTGTKTVFGVRVGGQVTGAGAGTATVNLTYFTTTALTLAGTTTAINIVGLNIASTNSAKATKITGITMNNSANAATIIVPLSLDGPARTTDTDGSVHRMNWQQGGTARGYGGGDGVMGFTNAVTVPTTNSAVGAIIFSSGAQMYQRGLMSVNEPIHSTLASLAAGTAYASSNAEAALSNAVFNFPANSLVAGAVFCITAGGVYSDTLTPTMQLRVRWGGLAGVLLGDSGAVVMGVSQTNVGWSLEFYIRVVSIGATGTVECSGWTSFNTTAILASFDNMPNTAVITIDTTAAKDLVLTGTWSANSASNTLTVRRFNVERM